MKIKGIVRVVFETKQVTDRFSKREFVVETSDNPRYPQTILLQATRDAMDALDRIHAGDEVDVDFDIRGREWRSPSGEVKYFNTLEAWKIEVTKAAPAPVVAGGSGSAQDDVPFRRFL